MTVLSYYFPVFWTSLPVNPSRKVSSTVAPDLTYVLPGPLFLPFDEGYKHVPLRPLVRPGPVLLGSYRPILP